MPKLRRDISRSARISNNEPQYATRIGWSPSPEFESGSSMTHHSRRVQGLHHAWFGSYCGVTSRGVLVVVDRVRVIVGNQCSAKNYESDPTMTRYHSALTTLIGGLLADLTSPTGRVRRMVQVGLQDLVDAEATVKIGAARHE